MREKICTAMRWNFYFLLLQILFSREKVRMNRRREQKRQERSENTKVKITDLSHRHTILFKVQYVHPYTYTCVHLYTAHTGTNTYSASICMYVRTLVARTVKGLGYTLYVSLYRARSTFVLDNEYIRHGI